MTAAVVATALEAFVADLTAGGVVTRVLEAWAGGPVHAERVAGPPIAASAETRARLFVAADTPVDHRHVRLVSGGVLLSEADNWFVPDRLTAAMRDALAASDTPFGIVIAPLAPHRRTLLCERLAGDPVLAIRALVLGDGDTPLALVEERYRRAVLG